MARRKARLTENDPLESKTDSILSSFTSKQQVNKSTSKKVENTDSQQVDQSTNKQSNKLKSQQFKNTTTQQPKNLTSKKADKLSTQEVKKSTGKQANKLISEESSLINSQEVDKTTSQQDKKPIQLKKATYKLSEDVIERLDRTYLQMSLERGRSNTPYKEVLVEEAIASFLDQLEENPDLVEKVLQRQEKRN